MALPLTAVWEVRPTVGSDTNGGGFDPAISGAGTDYSQQNAAQYSATDLASVSSLVVSSVSHSFGSADIGNIMNIASGTGFTPGFYEIVSVSAGRATLDRSPGTVGAGGAYAVGGALATITVAYATAALSNTIWVKATGTYTVTSALTLSGQNETSPFFFIGYTTTRGDGGKVAWTTATNSTPLVLMGTADSYNFVFQNFTFSSTAGTAANGFDGGLSGQSYCLRLSNCDFTGGFLVAVALGFVSGVHFNLGVLFMDFCLVTGCSSHGVVCSGATLLVACLIHGNGGNGVYGTVIGGGTAYSGAIRLERTVLYNNTAAGLSCDSAGTSPNTGTVQWPELFNCAVVGNGGDGIVIGNTGAGTNLVVVNTVIESNGGYGINNNDSAKPFIFIGIANAFRANTSGNYNGLAAQPSDIALTAEPFTNPSGLDFTLNSTTGGGTSCKGAGFPSALP